MQIKALWPALIIVAGCTNGVAQESRAAPSDDVAEARSTGEVTSRDYNLSGFTHVALMTPDNVEIVQGATFSVRATGDVRILDELEFNIEDGGLNIEYRDEGEHRFNHRRIPAATITITMPSLNGVSLAGSGDMEVGTFAAQEFEVSIAGSGNVAIASLQTGSAHFDIAGSGDLSVAGTAGSIDLDIAGSGDVAAADFRAESMELSIAGSGDVNAYVTGTVDASFVGSGDVTVRGGARCQSSAIGSGRLDCS